MRKILVRWSLRLPTQKFLSRRSKQVFHSKVETVPTGRENGILDTDDYGINNQYMKETFEKNKSWKKKEEAVDEEGKKDSDGNAVEIQ